MGRGAPLFADAVSLYAGTVMTPRPPAQLRSDALAIWQAAVAAVRSDLLVQQNVRVDRRWLTVAGELFELNSLERIVVVGAGKAGAGMAQGLERAFGEQLLQSKNIAGWLNVPADCVRTLSRIHLHAARPAGVNEPTLEGVHGSQEIIRMVEDLTPRDLCIALISGGGSALLPLPIDGITLEDKLAVTRFLSAAGAPIEELNTVRKQLSRIKGGGLARACKAGRLISLVISDVLGDPLDLIASGPTVADPSTPAEALAILEKYGARSAGISDRVFRTLETAPADHAKVPGCRVTNHVIGNNALAVAAAAQEAQRRGYRVQSQSAKQSEGPAEDVGRQLAERALEMSSTGASECFISGGEPTVKLVDSAQRGRGGRNQQLVLAAVERLAQADAHGGVILSGGTDGEDGPTDAAGALADAEIIVAAQQRGLNPQEYLARNDAYHWFEPLGGLIKTGPTHTNVCDVRVVLTDGS
jgi:hydroxypyruvate reductase